MLLRYLYVHLLVQHTMMGGLYSVQQNFHSSDSTNLQ